MHAGGGDAGPAAELARLVHAAAPRAGSTRVVALDGPSGSGKSTLAAELAASLQPWLGHRAPAVHMDDLYPGWDGLEEAVPRLLEQVLLPLSAGRVARWRRYDWEIGRYAEEHDVPPSPVVIVEGVASGSLECAEHLSLLVWVEARRQTRFRRGIERDGEEYRPHWERWAAAEQRHFARSRTRERADVLLDGDRDGRWRWRRQPRRLALAGVSTDTIIDVEQEQQREWADVATSVFLAPRMTDEEFAYRSPRYEGQRLRAAAVDDRIVATFRSFDTTLTVPGGTLPANAVSSVTVLPTHRRRGLLTQLIRADLAQADERGAPVSILIPSEAPIYGRFGFGPAAHTAAWQVDARAATFRYAVPGRLEVLRYEELRPHAPGVYDVARRRQPGAIDRSDLWWDMVCAVPPPPDGPDRSRRAVLYRDDEGAAQGYATYRTDDAFGLSKSEVTLTVEELVAATDDAYQALWQFCCEVDLVATVVAKDRSVDESLPWLLSNQRVAHQTSRTEFLWVRVHDPRTALAERRYSSACRLVLEVVDDGPAAGRFVLDVDGEGTATCESTRDAPDLTMPLATLGAVFLGGNSLGTLARAGWLEEHRPGALAAADAALRTPDVPWCGTWF